MELLEVMKQPSQIWRCSWCEVMYLVCEMEHIMCGMEITVGLQAYQDALPGEVVATRRPKSSETGKEIIQILSEILVFLDPFPERLTAKRQAVLESHRASRSSPCTWEQILCGGVALKSKAGSKRGFWERDTFLRNFHGYCGSSTSNAPSRRTKHFRVRDSNRNRKGANYGEGSNKSTYKASISITCKDKFYYICKSILKDMVHMPSLDSLRLGKEVCKTSTSTILSIHDLPALHWLLKEDQIVYPKKRRLVEVPSEEASVTKWDSLPDDVQENILQRVEFKDLFRFKTLSKACKKHIESDAFCEWRGATSPEGSFTAISYYRKNKGWQCTGYDLHSRMWRSLPTFSYLPAPDAALFKEYSLCGHGSLMCAEVSKLPKKGELVVFNPLTGKKRALPPLLYPRNPVLVHILVNSVGESYKVIVAGSSTASDEHLSKKMEVFDSNTSKWTEVCDLPGPAFGLNEHQAGICLNGILYAIAFLEGNCRRGLVAFDVENGNWLEDMACSIPFSLNSNTLQLVESNGKICLFSEQERGGSVEHCIDVLEFSSPNAGAVAGQWRNVVRVKKSGGRGLQVYPEYTCVGFGEGKLCVFNTLTRDGAVYDIQDGSQHEVLQPPPPDQMGDNFFSLNPTSFTLQPRFDSDPIPPTVDAI